MRRNEVMAGQEERVVRRRVTQDMISNVAQAAVIKKNRYHVHTRDGKWAVRKNGAMRALRLFATQQEAIIFAKQQEIKNPEAYIVVHDDLGRIEKIMR